MTAIGNIFAAIPAPSAAEQVLPLLSSQDVRIERIVSAGQASPDGFWYDEKDAEWVLVLAGSAALQLEDEAELLKLEPGDYIFIPPHRRHRVSFTDQAQPTIWLAVHIATAAVGSVSWGG